MGLSAFNLMRARIAAEEEAKRKKPEASSKAYQPFALNASAKEPAKVATKPRKKKASTEKSKSDKEQ